MKKILSGYLKFSVTFMKKLVSAESAHFWEKISSVITFSNIIYNIMLTPRASCFEEKDLLL